jgi:hypothetical protein
MYPRFFLLIEHRNTFTVITGATVVVTKTFTLLLEEKFTMIDSGVDNSATIGDRAYRMEVQGRALFRNFQELGYAISMSGKYERASKAYEQHCRVTNLPCVVVRLYGGQASVGLALPVGLQFTREGKQRIREQILAANRTKNNPVKVGKRSVTQTHLAVDGTCELAEALLTLARSPGCVRSQPDRPATAKRQETRIGAQTDAHLASLGEI